MPGLGGSIIEVQSDKFYDKNSFDQRINGKKNKDNLDVMLGKHLFHWSTCK